MATNGTAKPITPDFISPVAAPSAPVEAIALTHNPWELIERALTQNADVDRLGKLIEWHRQWQRDEARRAFDHAIAAFKANPPQLLKTQPVRFQPKDAGKPEVSYSYAPLDQICDAVIPELSKYGLSHRWKTAQEREWITVTCILKHESGHFEECQLSGTADTSGSKNAVQAIASTVSYLERYTLLAVLGLAAKGTDTDARAVTIDAQPAAITGQVCQRSGVPADRLDEMLRGLATAPDYKNLSSRFQFAYSEASKHHDANAQQAYIRAKDARLREIRSHRQ